jgi:DMSO/TMAO reductase YedYZ molybdopterin-dependent catalytic subunit
LKRSSGWSRSTRGRPRTAAARQEQHFYVPNSVAPGNLATPSWLTTDLGLALPADYDGSAEGRRLTLVLEDAQGGVLRRAQVSLAQLEGMPAFAAAPEPVAWRCVTGWNKTGLRFHGVPLCHVLALLQLGEQEVAGWTHLIRLAADGYKTPVFRQDALAPGCLLATREGDARYPRRTVALPHLWGCKSAKHLTDGAAPCSRVPRLFWERLSCHERGRLYDADTGLLVDERA